MSRLHLRSILTWLLIGGSLVIPRPLRAADELIPSSLPKEKRERLTNFLEQVKKQAKGGFILADGNLTALDPRIKLAPTTAKDDQVEEYLAAVILHRATDATKGPEMAQVYWYRPHPTKGAAGVTVKRVIDLTSGKEKGPPEVLVGYPAPLTREEREQAIALAKEEVPALKDLLADGQKDVILEVLFETVTSEKNPDGDIGDRVVSLRIRKKGEKGLVAADVNLTKQKVRVPK